jgi:transposase
MGGFRKETNTNKKFIEMKKTIFKQNIGVDIAKDDFKVVFSAFVETSRTKILGSRTFSNSLKGCKDFLDWATSKMDKSLELHVTMEATGIYHETLCYFLCREPDVKIHVVLPNLAKKYGQSLGIKSKTDKIDAQILSQMGLERELITWQPISKDLLFLRQIVRERSVLQKSKTAVKNQLHAYCHQGRPNQASIARAKTHIAFLDEQVLQIEQEIKSFVDADQKLKTKLSYLTSIPGVGLITAVSVVAETGGFETFTSIKQLTSFAGLDVKIRESGKWKGKSKISKRGNSHIRRALYMSALVAARYAPTIQNVYKRIHTKHGSGMVAIVAVERKLLGLMYSLWKNEQMYKSVA